MANEIYNRTVFKRFFEVNDEKVLAWAENVLAKISSPGILPSFIEKKGEDFQAYWGAITHLFALIVLYGRQYNQIDTNKILFELFIDNRGLVTNEVVTEEQMQYLFDNYIKEYEKRGKLDIISKEGIILGELLRLLQYKQLDEFIFAVLMPRDTGWTLGYSSPMWNRADTILNITKGYEMTESVEDLSNYPLINETGVIQLQDQDNDGNSIQVMSFVGDVLTGIGSTDDDSKLLIVSEDLAYQISCKVKVSDIANQNLSFGVQVYDELKRPMSCIESFGAVESNSFTSGENGLQLINNGVYYELRGTIFKKNRSFTGQLPLNFLNGRGLKFVEGIKYLSLYLVQDRSKPSSDVYIYDIKIKPIYLPFYQGYLGEKNVIASYYENNSSSSNTNVNAFIENYLISYKNVLKASEIFELELTNVKFKVISDRRVQIEGASILINNQTLTTDVNGEAIIQLYPGDYLYSVTKENFIPIENEVISIIEEEEQIVYISLQGELYERKIIFSVRDENNVPLSGATVTFNGKYQQTGSDGTTTFMAYPGLYPYSVTKDNYYVVDKSILVMDDMVEDVVMELIPVSTLTFNVKNGTTPVSGVTITVTSRQQLTASNANDRIFSQSLITDDNGQAIFRDIVNGEYAYSAEKVDWLPVSANLTVAGDQIIEIAFNPVPTYVVVFTVNNYNPFTGAKATLQGASVVFAGISKITDDKGQASFTVKANTYQYTISANGFVTQTDRLAVTGDTQKIIDLSQNQYATTFKVTGVNGVALKNATVTIGSKSQQTDLKGETVFQLPNGNYDYQASYQEYHPKTGSFVVSNNVQTINVPMDQVLYNVTFTVKEEGLISVGATVRLGDQQKTTSNQGVAVFQVPMGSYIWSVSKNIYVTQTGNIDVTGSAVTREINLIRKNGTVTFVVRNDSGAYVEGATVICGGQTKLSNVNGQAVFTLPIADYSYDVSKLPDYTSQSGDVSVTEAPQTVNVLLSNKTYTVTFRVRVEWGGYVNNQVRNTPVFFNGKTIYTDSQGQATFTEIKNGNYTYIVANDGGSYVSQTSQITIANSDRIIDITLVYKTLTSTITVYRDGSRASNVSIYGEVKYKGGYGNNYTTINGTTNSSGQISFSCPADGYFDFQTQDTFSRNISKTGNTNGTDQTVYLYRALILTFNTSAQSIINSTGWLNASNAEADGNTLKVCPSYSGSSTPGYLSSGSTFEGKTSLLSVDQWPISWGFNSGNYMFSGCTNLSSVATGSPRISGNINSYFKNCASLRSVPNGFFSNVSGNDARECCRYSGVGEAPSNFFSNNISLYEYCFADCPRLTSAASNVFGTGGSEIGGVFMNCTNLTSVNGNVFYNCDYVTSIAYCFSGCTSLRTIPSNLFRYTIRATNARGVFSGCTQLTALPSGLFNYITASVDFTTVCYNCINLSSIATNVFPTSMRSINSAFKGCSSLSNVDNFVKAYPYCTDAFEAFMGSGLTSIRGDFFKGWTRLTTVQSCFNNCKNLQSINVNYSALFQGCTALASVEGCFSNCTNLAGSVFNLAAPSDNFIYTVKKYTLMFNGCKNLPVPLIHSPSGLDVPLYSFIDLLISQGEISGVTRTGGFRGCTKLINSANPPSSAWL